jgi:hypothetical protein
VNAFSFLAILYLSLGIGCVTLATRSLQTGRLISKRGIKGTRLEHSETLRWIQIVSAYSGGLGLLVYGLVCTTAAFKH